KKVYPEDVEKKLNNHPLVVDSTVFGLQTPDGERVHAEVITKNAKKLKEIVDTVNKQLNPHEQILDFAQWTQHDFPRTKTLKVDRDAVRNEVMQRKSQTKIEQKHTEADHDILLSVLQQVSGKKEIRLHSNTMKTYL